MKVLIAIQGTGNGHLARATEIVPLLSEMAETDVLVSGTQADLKLPFEVKYRFYGMSFVFGTNGGVDIRKTIFKLRIFRFLKDIFTLPVHRYNLVICDFEPVTAWACKIQRKKCVGLSHQNAVLHHLAPKPQKTDWLGKIILKRYAPVSLKYGFHFYQLDSFNFPPVIRSDVRKAKTYNNNHYTVYLPSFSNEEIERVLTAVPQVQWEVFSKHNPETYQSENILFQPVSFEKFNMSFTSCQGILCNAGFETPAEALYMGKKLCVIPMKNQYEQACNAAFLSDMGITALSDFKKSVHEIRHWVDNGKPLIIQYPDITKEILEKIILRNEI
jgi:uncharacterized protein (TIGR00661 family)